MTDFRALFPTFGLSAILVGLIAYVLFYPEKAEKVAGWAWTLFYRIFGAGNRKAVAYSVQGNVNAARAALMKNAPDGVLDSKLKLKWTNPEEARALMREGDVVVFMKKARHKEENIANAVMAFLPSAVVPRARRYVDRDIMRCVDLTLARAILQFSRMPKGALDVFFEKHLDPALANDEALREQLADIDRLDMHGWLTRVMLNEYRRLGDRLYPGECNATCLRDAQGFAVWLANLAKRRPRDFTTPLLFQGNYMSAGMVFVAMKGRVEVEGVEPYRKQAKRLIYAKRCDVVFLMARDDNIGYVKELRKLLATDGLIESVESFEYALRPDFRLHVVKRDRAIIVALRRKGAGDLAGCEAEEDEDDAAVEIYDVAVANGEPGTTAHIQNDAVQLP